MGLNLYNAMKTLLNQPFENLTISARKKSVNVINVHLGCKILFLEFHEIVYLQGDGNYTYVYTTQGKRYLISKTMKAIQKILDAGFLRIHKSYMINPMHLLERINPDKVILNGGKQLPIARRRIMEIQETLAGEYLNVG
jgi:two-component system LytT family response regulator